tara:strand:+ start:78 stop:461 length:384 start_codon:yes stop_codon:yes gene_type:complete
MITQLLLVRGVVLGSVPPAAVPRLEVILLLVLEQLLHQRAVVLVVIIKISLPGTVVLVVVVLTPVCLVVLAILHLHPHLKVIPVVLLVVFMHRLVVAALERPGVIRLVITRVRVVLVATKVPRLEHL